MLYTFQIFDISMDIYIPNVAHADPAVFKIQPPIPASKLNDESKTSNLWERYQQQHLDKLFGKSYCEHVPNKKELLRRHLKTTENVESLLCMCYMAFAMNLVNATNTNDTYFYDRNILLDEWNIRNMIRSTYWNEFEYIILIGCMTGCGITCVLIFMEFLRKPGATKMYRVTQVCEECVSSSYNQFDMDEIKIR